MRCIYSIPEDKGDFLLPSDASVTLIPLLVDTLRSVDIVPYRDKISTHIPYLLLFLLTLLRLLLLLLIRSWVWSRGGKSQPIPVTNSQ